MVERTTKNGIPSTCHLPKYLLPHPAKAVEFPKHVTSEESSSEDADGFKVYLGK